MLNTGEGCCSQAFLGAVSGNCGSISPPPTVMDNNKFYKTNLALSPHLVPEVEQGVQDERVPHPVHGEGRPPDMAVVEQVEVGEQIGQNVRQRERTVKQEKYQDGQHPENANTSLLNVQTYL